MTTTKNPPLRNAKAIVADDENTTHEEEWVEGEELDILDDDDDAAHTQLTLDVGGPPPTQSLLRLKANKETSTAGGTQWQRGDRVMFDGQGEIVEIRFDKKGRRIHVLEIDVLTF